MNGFKIPLDFSPGNFFEKNLKSADKHADSDITLKESIDDFIKLLVNSPNGSFKPNPQFGFSLKNCYFENANSKDEIKGKRVGGKGENANNYARDLLKAIELFELRLQNLELNTDFDKKESKMTISITGQIVENKKKYNQDLEFYIWKNNEDIRRIQ
jgi:predicted component of type VI protein secretion system